MSAHADVVVWVFEPLPLYAVGLIVLTVLALRV